MPRVYKPPVFRPWIKKRGARVLGSALRGAAGEALFFAGLFLMGTFGLSLILIHRFAPERAPEVSTETFSVGIANWIFGILSCSAIVSGSVGLAFQLMRFGASNERRSAIASRAQSMEMIGPTADDAPRLPNVPKGRSLTDSPGERLTYRLAANTSPTSRLAGPAVLSLLWNAVWFVLLAVVVSGFWIDQPRWILAGLLIPFGGIGIWSFRFFLAQLRQLAGVGPTIVEISEHPLLPGHSYRLFVAQMGRLKLRRLKIGLACEEVSFFSQGTDVRVERHEAFNQLLHKEVNVRVDPQRPWEQQLHFDFPDHVMHSFVGSHNAVHWKIVVTGESRPWPSFSRSFPIVVHPPGLPLKRSPR